MLSEDKSERTKNLVLAGLVRNQVSLMDRSSLFARPSFHCMFLRRRLCSLNPLAGEFLFLVHECWSYRSEMHLKDLEVALCPPIWLSALGLSPFLGISFSRSRPLVVRQPHFCLMLLCTWKKPCLHSPNTGCVISPGSRKLLWSFCYHRRSQEVLDVCGLPWTSHTGGVFAQSARSWIDYLKGHLQAPLPVTHATPGEVGGLSPSLAPRWRSPSTCAYPVLSSSH